MIDVAEPRDPPHLRLIDRTTPVDLVLPDSIVNPELPTGMLDRQAHDERPDEAGRRRRVAVAVEVPAGRIDQHVGERRGEVLARRQHLLDVGEDRVDVEAEHRRTTARGEPDRAADLRVDSRLAALAERRRLAMLDEPVDELRVVDVRHAAVRQRDARALVQRMRALAEGGFVERVECLAQIFETHAARRFLMARCQNASAPANHATATSTDGSRLITTNTNTITLDSAYPIAGHGYAVTL